MFYSNFELFQRSAERPNCPTSGVIWRWEWGYLADFFFELGNRAVTFENWLGALRGEKMLKVYTTKILLDTDFTSIPLPSQPCGCSTVLIGCAQASPKRYKVTPMVGNVHTLLHAYMLWASKPPPQQCQLFRMHFFRLTPFRTRFRMLWLRSGLSEFNVSVISSELDFFVSYT